MAAVLVLVASAALAEPPGTEARVTAAIERAVAARMGDVAITVETQIVRWHAGEPGAELVAVPEPGQRVGGPVRFRLYELVSGRRASRSAGVAQGEVHVRARAVVARVAIDRGATIQPSQIDALEIDVGRLPLTALPTPHDVAGSVARRPIAPGELVTGHAIRTPPLVRSGDELVLRALVRGVEVTAKAIAAQAGGLGDLIRVVNSDSGRAVKGVVVGPGEVEVRYAR
jgi:flagella basal body P-ring formation protein FlgA